MRRDRGKDVMNAQGQPVMGLIGVMRRALAYWRPYWVQGVLIVLAMLALIGLIVHVPPLFVLEWQLALLFVAALPLIIFGTRAFTPRASRANYQLKQDQGQLASTVHESVRAQPVVKVFGLQDSVLASFRQQLAGIARSTVRANFLTLLVGTASSLGVLLVQLVER